MKIVMHLAGLAVAAAACAGHAQTTGGKIRMATQPKPPPATAAIASRPLPGAPSANGLASPFPPSVASPGTPGTSDAGTLAPTPARSDINSGLDIFNPDYNAPNTAVMGAGAYGSRGATRPAIGPVSAVDVARSFLTADSNRDGELSRAEATRLSILPLTFEEMDANHDDRLTRSEYEDAVR